MKPTRFIDSANCAIEGIIHGVRSQRHLRLHFVASLGVFALALLLRVTAMEFALLAISIAFVLFAELMNTAIEAVVDLASPEYHDLARIAKDTAAGGVLVATIGAAVMGYLILAQYIFPLYKRGLLMIGTPTDMGTLVSILVVVMVVVILKGRSGRGTPLEGGMPSGHAAVAFAIATAVSLTSQDPLTSLLSFMLALMVSHSRLLLRIHSLREVIFGALLGGSLTLIIHLLFRSLPA
ncbi:MAG TPA: diacylglycerol kinase [Geobacterales bacterium]|nr:diacylglycerol kinase [Geobacterales bacterium]